MKKRADEEFRAEVPTLAQAPGIEALLLWEDGEARMSDSADPLGIWAEKSRS